MRKLLSYTLISLIFGFLLFNIYKNWELVISVNWRFGFLRIVTILILIVFVYFTNILAWHLITKSLGIGISFKKNSRIWVLSNATRFLPGTIWQYLGRVYLLSKENVTKGKAFTAIAIEGFLNISIGSIIALFTILFWQMPIQKGVTATIILFALIFSTAIFILASSNLTNKVLNFLLEVSGRKMRVNVEGINKNYLPALILAFIMHFILSGLLLFIIATTVIDLTLTQIPFFIGIFTSSWLLGYITFIAPGGIGVMEVGTASFLSFYVPFAIGTIIALAFRITLLLAEAIWVALVLLFF